LVGFADLAKIVARLPRDDARDLAFSLGFETLEPGARAPSPPLPQDDVEAPTPEAKFAAAVAALEAQSQGPSRPPAAFWRVERYEPAPDAPEATAAPAVVITEPLLENERGGGLFDTPEAPPLTPWRHLWPTLQQALRTELPGRDPDVAALVHRWSRGEPVSRIPHLPRRAWASRASLWIDQSPHLIPLWNDQLRVERGLHRVFGRALETRWLGRRASNLALTSPRGWLHGQRLDDTTPVLVLGDLGALKTDGAVRWAGALRAMAARGVRVTAVVPWSLRRHPDRAVRGCRMVAWERARSVRAGVGEAVDAGEGGVVTLLLRLASVAAFVQPGLLRELRWLLPGADIEAELRAWSDPSVEEADDSVMLLRPDALTTLRQGFVALDPGLRLRVSDLLRRWHARMPGEVMIAETLRWREVSEDVPPPGDYGAACAFVERLATMLSAGTAADAEAWRHYGRVLLEGMPSSTYRELPALAKVWDVAFEGVDGAVPPEGVDVATLRALRKGVREETRAWALRQVGDALVVAPRGDLRWPSDETGPGSPVAVVEVVGAEVLVTEVATRTLRVLAAGHALTTQGDLRVVRASTMQRMLAQGRALTLPATGHMSVRTTGGTLQLVPWTREPWATAAGRDVYGLWAEVTVAGVVFRMRWIPPGRFMMGASAREEWRWRDVSPQRVVVMTQGFWLGELPVTQALWRAVVGQNPSYFKGGDRPVERVKWKHSQAFVKRLNEKVQGLDLRLPTEWEWEYACRAGTEGPTWLGINDAKNLDRIAWYYGNSGGETHPVGSKEANPFGLYDMLGNVTEWCEGRQAPNTAELVVEPSRPTPLQILRGSSWRDDARRVRAAARKDGLPAGLQEDIGFRLARGQTAPSQARGR